MYSYFLVRVCCMAYDVCQGSRWTQALVLLSFSASSLARWLGTPRALLVRRVSSLACTVVAAPVVAPTISVAMGTPRRIIVDACRGYTHVELDKRPSLALVGLPAAVKRAGAGDWYSAFVVCAHGVEPTEETSEVNRHHRYDTPMRGARSWPRRSSIYSSLSNCASGWQLAEAATMHNLAWALRMEMLRTCKQTRSFMQPGSGARLFFSPEASVPNARAAFPMSCPAESLSGKGDDRTNNTQGYFGLHQPPSLLCLVGYAIVAFVSGLV